MAKVGAESGGKVKARGQESLQDLPYGKQGPELACHLPQVSHRCSDSRPELQE